MTIVDSTGRSHLVIGRAARMMLQLIVYADRINAAHYGSFAFHFGEGEKVKPRLEENLREVS